MVLAICACWRLGIPLVVQTHKARADYTLHHVPHLLHARTERVLSTETLGGLQAWAIQGVWDNDEVELLAGGEREARTLVRTTLRPGLVRLAT